MRKQVEESTAAESAELCARTFRTFPREFSSRNRSGPSRRSPVASSGLSVVSERLMIA